MEQVERVSSVEALRACVDRNDPCVYRLPSESRPPCFEVWTKQGLSARVGTRPVAARYSPSGAYIDPAEGFWSLVAALRTRRMSFARYLESGIERGMMLSGTETYLYEHGRPVGAWRELWDDVRGLIAEPDDASRGAPLCSEEELHTVGLWISGCGVRSILHYDDSGDNNLNLQVAGRKRVTLFPPSDWRRLDTLLALGLHPFEVYASLYGAAEVDPRLAGTAPRCAELEVGDLLYIPSRWYHFVEHQGAFNVNVTCWFERGPVASGPVVAPRRSCRSVLKVLRLVSALLLALTLNGIGRLLAAREGRGA
ncbi:MAG: cupin-like domain-containing protein [Planctomycetota bacterium]|nr:cupin-like domain-containing protein [Planctomycetota bacterium]